MNQVSKVVVTIRNTVKYVREKRDGYFENSYSNGKCQKWREMSPNPEEPRKFFTPFTEYKFLICLICFSSTIVLCKIPIVYKDAFRRIFSLGKIGWSKPLNLVNYDFLSVPIAFLTAIWSVIVDLNWLFIPAIVGVVTSLITWRIVYLNSRIPGIDPPSPYFPSLKERFQQSSFYTGSIASSYKFALVVGILVFLVLLFQQFFYV